MVYLLLGLLIFFLIWVIERNANSASHSSNDSHPVDVDQIIKEQEANDSSSVDIDQTLKEQEKYFAYYDEPIVGEHYKNLETIEQQYSVLYNLKQFHSVQMDSLISLCERDISIAEEFRNICLKYDMDIPYSYGSFKRLAIIYYKRKEYEKAIDVCVRAIQTGFADDGTPGKMYGRLARMIRLSGINNSPEFYLKNN